MKNTEPDHRCTRSSSADIWHLILLEEDINYLLEHINTDAPFTLDRSQILVGTHGQYTPAIGAALYYVEKFTQSV